MSKGRKPICALYIGANGTGKSTAAFKLMKKRSGKEPVFIVSKSGLDDTFDKFQEIDIADKKAILKFKKGFRRVFYSRHGDRTFALMMRNLRNCSILFDDCIAYIKSHGHEDLEELLIHRRHVMIDMAFVMHTFAKIPPMVYDYSSHVLLFRTSGGLDRARAKVHDYELLKRLSQVVNAKARKKPFYHVTITI